MKFIADLHVHSKYSRATAKNLDLENLYIAAQLKGITLVGTGDFTHPTWFSEINEKLIPAEPGLFRLKEEIAEQCDLQVPPSCRGDVRFILQCEISNIYKKNGKTRKNHQVIFMPDMETVSRFNAKLDNIGNIKSDGRPILGLDAKELLRILLETSDNAFLIPAHIWTPWFSILGSKSGFDSIEECFEELTPEIFAAETGLSSDPPMNWRVSGLDNLTLVSNSDAHSPMNLGRNANLFDTELSYFAIKSALKTGNPAQCLGTLDMYPEEGKYHFDGHRKCHVCLHPTETMEKEGICPFCQKPLTIGVLYRVEELADKPEGVKSKKGIPFYHIIPLAEMLSEILGVGPNSKKVNTHYQATLKNLGPELKILHDFDTEVIEKAGIPLLGEAVRRMRSGEVHIAPGYDGEYGRITLFTLDEMERLLGQESLFVMKNSSVKKRSKKTESPFKKKKPELSKEKIAETPSDFEKKEIDILNNLNEKQRQAVEHKGTPLLIIAGPGAGKTRTLTHRIAYIIKHRNILPENILAVTFTNKAAQEMKDRLNLLITDSHSLPFVGTFHALCLRILKDHKAQLCNPESKAALWNIADEEEQKSFISEAIRQVREKGIPVDLKPNTLSDMILSAKQQILTPDENLESIAPKEVIPLLSEVYQRYQSLLEQERRYDYEDLILNVVKLLESDSNLREKYQNQWQYIFVDEYQDLNQGQYRIIKVLAPLERELCVIGDPDQAIYGFRGSDVKYFQEFVNDYPKSKVIHLTQNYRSTETILEASYQIIRNHSINPARTRVYSNIKGIRTLTIFEPATEKAEAVAVGKTIEKMIGGMGFHSIDFGKTSSPRGSWKREDHSFSDFAVLYRTHAQSQVISEIFEKAGIPYQIANRENIYKRKGIVELLSFFKIIENIGILNDFQRIAISVGSGISKKGVDRFKDWFYQEQLTLTQALSNLKQSPIAGMDAKLRAFVNTIFEFKRNLAEKSVVEKLSFIAENTNISEMINENPRTSEIFDALIHKAKEFGNQPTDFFEMISLQNHDADAYELNAEKVTLMTLHAAKGLEFPVVFITGCENDYIPFRRSENDETDMDEERRLFYVAMTRAKERLFLSYAKKRTIYGKTVQREISPFVADIEKRLINLEKSQPKKPKRENQIQLGLF